MELGGADRVVRAQPVIGRQHDHEPLLEDRQLVKRFGQFLGNADDRHLELAFLQHLDHLRRAGVDHLHLDVGMLRRGIG